MKRLVMIFAALALLTGCAKDQFWQVACNFLPRPQEPRDRPYVVEQDFIDGGNDDVRLAGELTMPEGDGPFPGIVLVSGSEVVDRDSKILGHKPFLVLSDFLTRNGYSVLRYDDRGFGQSTGNTYEARDIEFAADAAAAFEWLTSQRKIDPLSSGYVGHSQGANKAVIAAQTTSPSFLIFLGGGVQPVGTLLIDQARVAGIAAGMSREDQAVQVQELTDVFQILNQSETLANAQEGLREWAAMQGASWIQSRRLINGYATPWMWAEARRGSPLFADIDEEHARMLNHFSEPILALYGEKDQLVTASINAPLTVPLLNHDHSSVMTIPGVNHFFQPADDGGLDEMCEIQTTIDPIVLETIRDWLKGV